MKRKMLILFLSYFLIIGLSNIFNNPKDVNQKKKFLKNDEPKDIIKDKSKDEINIDISNEKDFYFDKKLEDEDRSKRIDEKIREIFEDSNLGDNYGR